MADYNQYRNQQRQYARAVQQRPRGAPTFHGALRQRKKEIRASAQSWLTRKSCSPSSGSIRSRSTRSEAGVQQRRQEAFPKPAHMGCRTRRRGDARQRYSCVAALCGSAKPRWLDARLESDALHITPSPENGTSRLVRLRATTAYRRTETTDSCQPDRAPRIWKIDRKTGDVSYALNGQVSVIDRGRIVTVLNQDKAAVSWIGDGVQNTDTHCV